MYIRSVSHVDVYLTGRVEDHVLHYAFEVDGTKQKGNYNAASSELEASASAVYIAIKKTAETYPNAGEITLHTDIEKPFGYLDGRYKPTTDTMKKFVRAVEKLKKSHNFELSADKEIPKEVADTLYNSAFGSAPTSLKNDSEKKDSEQSKSVPEQSKPAPATKPKSVASRWAKGAKAKQEQQTATYSPAYEPAKRPSQKPKPNSGGSEIPKELEGEWIGWDEKGFLMTFPSFEDAVTGNGEYSLPAYAKDDRGVLMSYATAEDIANGNGVPVYANGQQPPADSMGYRRTRPEPQRTAPKQNIGAGKGWMRKGVVLDANPLDAPKREPKSQAFENWHGKSPKPKWGAMALDENGAIIAEVNSRNLPESCKKDAEYMADWWEQVDKYKVIREGLERGKFDFRDKLDANGNYKGLSMTAVDLTEGKESMTVWKDGMKIYNGGITDEYKQNYVNSHNDDRALQWAAELEAKKAAAEKQEEEPKYEQMNLFDILRDDDPFGI